MRPPPAVSALLGLAVDDEASTSTSPTSAARPRSTPSSSNQVDPATGFRCGQSISPSATTTAAHRHRPRGTSTSAWATERQTIRSAGQDPDQIRLDRSDRPTPTEREPAIPADNPSRTAMVSQRSSDRSPNPWRIAFDPMTNDLWVAESARTAGRKSRFCSAPTAGPRRHLGGDCERARRCGRPAREQHRPGLRVPHGDGVPSGCSITGGEVYRVRDPALFAPTCSATTAPLGSGPSRSLR